MIYCLGKRFCTELPRLLSSTDRVVLSEGIDRGSIPRGVTTLKTLQFWKGRSDAAFSMAGG